MILSILLNTIYICFMVFMFFMAMGFGGAIAGPLFIAFLFIVTFPRVKHISRALWRAA